MTTHSEANHKHYLANKEKYKARAKSWNTAHPEYMKKLQQDLRKRNPDKNKETQRK